MSNKPLNSMLHCRTKEASKKLKPTALYPYFFKNTIKNPNPINTITWISWNTEIDDLVSRNVELIQLLKLS